jgi:cell division protein FtsQ
MKKRIVIVVIWVFSILLFISVLWIVVVNYGKNSCREIQISINAPADAEFITEQDVRSYITMVGDSLIGSKIAAINIENIETIINKNPFVFSSKVYVTLGGIVKIDIKQRTPIVRVQNVFDQGYYISDDGYLMPIVEGKTSRVLFANGFISDLYMNSLQLDIDSTKTEKDTIPLNKNLVKIYRVARFINKDPFWKAQIQQLYLDKTGRILMMPLVGDQIIILGDAFNIPDKFEKLRMFYRRSEFLSSWNNYDTININFNDQIVCSKKTILKTK